MPYERPLTYREWLDNRFNEPDDESDELEDGVEPESEDTADDGFPLHDDYSEESKP